MELGNIGANWLTPRMLLSVLFALGFVGGEISATKSTVDPSIAATKSLLNPSNEISPSRILLVASSASSHSSSANNSFSKYIATMKPKHDKVSEGIKVAKWDFSRVQTPFVVCIWILLASIAKIGMKKLFPSLNNF